MDDAGITIEAEARVEPDAPAAGGGPPWRVEHEITLDIATDATRQMTGELRRLMTVVAAGAFVAGIVLVLLGVRVFGPMVAMFGILTYALWNLPAAERWLLRRRWGPLIGGTQVLEIGEAGIEVANPMISGHVPWTALTEVRTSDRTAVFLRGGALVTFVPLDALGPPEQQAEIVAFARDRVGRT